jgi:hypothetical protein
LVRNPRNFEKLEIQSRKQRYEIQEEKNAYLTAVAQIRDDSDKVMSSILCNRMPVLANSSGDLRSRQEVNEEGPGSGGYKLVIEVKERV